MEGHDLGNASQPWISNERMYFSLFLYCSKLGILGGFPGEKCPKVTLTCARLENLQFTSHDQALMTVVGNITCGVAAHRLYKGSENCEEFQNCESVF
jgi:hypothetical protein